MLPDDFKEHSDMVNEYLDSDQYPYAPLFRSTNDDVYYTVTPMMSMTEEEADEHGKMVEVMALGTDGSTEYTGIVVDLRALPLWSGLFKTNDGNDFPVIVIDWKGLH